MKKLFILLIICGCAKVMSAQRGAMATEPKVKTSEATVKALASTITVADLKEKLTILASDDFEGRETGQEGQKKAAKYIADQFKSMGLPAIGENKSYYQSIGFSYDSWDDIYIEVKGEKYKFMKDFYAFPSANNDMPTIETDEVVFLGYGIDDDVYSDYNGVDVKDKVILIYQGEPLTKDSISHITGSLAASEWTLDWRKKLRTAKAKGVKAVLFIESNVPFYVDRYRRVLLGGRMSLTDGSSRSSNFVNSAYISTNVAKAIIGKKFKKVIKARKKIQTSGKPRNVVMPTKLKLAQKKNSKSIYGENVLGYIEGNDPKMKDEVVIITAHYDHLGKRGDDIFNGADDNGSGSSTVLEVAEAFAKAKKEGTGPRRSVLVMLVSGEEKGLLGSKFYVERPIFPIAKTVANVNVDMVGRVDEKHEDNPNYIYVIGSNRLSTELHEINEEANKKYVNIELDYTYNAEDDPNRYYYRSDHYNFAEKGIPAIFYFNGTHEDYHRPSDTVEKINFSKMEKIARLVFYTAWELANRDKRIEVNVPQKEK